MARRLHQDREIPVPGPALPYGRHWIDEEDIAVVAEILRSEWLTTGPAIEEFESALASFTGSPEVVAVSSGTAALHCAVHAAGIGPGEEVIVPALTFVASANCVLYQGGRPVFADVDPETLLIDPRDVERKLSPKTRAVIAVDYGGQPCEYEALEELCRSRDLVLIADSSHSLGATYQGRAISSIADLSTYSFHPVKHMTTGEGGAVASQDEAVAARMRCFRNHGIDSDHHVRSRNGTWSYEMVELGYNYRITDFQCALGRNQLKKLPMWLKRRRQIARQYRLALADLPGVTPLKAMPDRQHAYHLFTIKLEPARFRGGREGFYQALRIRGVGANVHYIPVHLHPYYRQKLGTGRGMCPAAESVFQEIITLPLFPRMTDREVLQVIGAVWSVAKELRR